MLSLKILRCRFPRGVRHGVGVVLASLVLVGGAARAQTTTLADSAPPDSPAALPRPLDVEVDRHAALGQRLLEHGRTQEAIAEFRRAYELRADPRFLYDIAEGYRRLGLADQARFFYERYLSAAPDAPDREEVEAALAALGRPAPAARACAAQPRARRRDHPRDPGAGERAAPVAQVVGLDGVRRARRRGRRDRAAHAPRRDGRSVDGARRQEVLLA